MHPEETPDRRALLGLGLGAAAGAVLVGGRAAGQAEGAGGNAVPNLYPHWAALQFQEFQRNENAHVPAIEQLIRSLGGTPRPRPTFKDITATSAKQFATLTRTFANTGAGAYRGGGPVIFSRSTLARVAPIAQIEARHCGWINHALNLVETTDVFGNEQAFEQPLTQDQVVNLASPFIASLNGGPPPRFNLTPSAANDIQILNFALILEYLEQDFYNINVPRFFPT